MLTTPIPFRPRPAAQSAMAGLRVHCFGQFEVIRDGVAVHDWRRDKARTLLKHLIARRGSIQRDVLLDLLWPELEPESAARNLRVTLHALRRAVAGDVDGDRATAYILTRGDGYELNPQGSIWVDVDHFSSLVDSGMRLDRQGRLADAVAAYEAAEALYRGDYLVDDLYAEWALMPRERLKDQYLMVLTRLADVALAAGDVEGGIAFSHKILAHDVCREDAYQRLIQCHERLGGRSRALRWYEVCRDTLSRELNVTPSETTVRLIQHIAGGSQPAA